MSENRVIREQRRLSRKKKGSKNYEKQRIKLARMHEHIAAQRTDYNNKKTTELLADNAFIGIEKLNVRAMLHNPTRSKGLNDAALSSFLNILKKKAGRYGTKIVEVSPYFPSSKLCSVCGYKNIAIKDDRIRRWVCPKCGKEHDRDINAAINILCEAKRIITEKH